MEEHLGYCTDARCVITVIFYVIIFVLGITGNGAVIWITGFKMKKSVKSTWYLSLAVSDLVSCAPIPFIIDNRVTYSWNFGLFMCKFYGFVMPLCIYSHVFILVIMSLDRCITLQFPAWAQNQRSVKKASLVVVFAWILSSSLSVPSAHFREVIDIGPVDMCATHIEDFKTVVFMLFALGFLIPFLIIFILIHKLRANQAFKSTKPYRIMTLLIAAFFICWLPFHITSILKLDRSKHSLHLFRADLIFTILATANSFLNPFIYVLMAKDVKKKWYSFLSKIESAMNEETQSAVEATSNADSVDNRTSAAV